MLLLYLLVGLNALKHEAQVRMRRLMSGTSSQSDEARLVGNQPLSFDLEQTNGVASTSGTTAHPRLQWDDRDASHSLTALNIKMHGVLITWGRRHSRFNVQHQRIAFCISRSFSGFIQSPFFVLSRQRPLSPEPVVGCHLSHSHRRGGRGSAVPSLRVFIPDLDGRLGRLGSHHCHQPVHRLAASCPA